MRIGFGLDRHRLVEGRPCILGGVTFADCPVGPLGHSDGDAVCHAAADAILGAAALGDIGRHFPDTDPRHAGADSLDLLRQAAALAREAGWQVGNLDVTVMTERPRIAPRATVMAANLAAAVGADPGQISIKATRGEGLGPEGRGEAVTVHAVVLLRAVAD
jgi:2-C-methyl-D-erythritol 2,4-cyclodiphosphate synthase